MYDDIFRALADEHRRQLLQSLAEHDPQNEISATSAVHEEDTGVNRLTVEMVHVHLPLLEDCGLITWNRANDRVMRGPNFEKIRQILESMPDESNID